MGLIHRALAFINGLVIGTILGAAVLVQIGGTLSGIGSVMMLAGVGALSGSVFAGFKWLAGISGGIVGGLLAVGFLMIGLPLVPGVKTWIVQSASSCVSSPQKITWGSKSAGFHI